MTFLWPSADVINPNPRRFRALRDFADDGDSDASKSFLDRFKTFLYNDYYVPRDAIRGEITGGALFSAIGAFCAVCECSSAQKPGVAES